MASPTRDADPETILAHANWLHRLALRLAQDPNLAEDLTQSTWMTALESPPPQKEHLRSWLGTVLKNAWAEGIRRDMRRHARERIAAKPLAEISAAELVEKVEVQRQVMQAVLDLDELYRGPILMRYFEGQAPRHIAARLDLPVATIKTRLHRGLAQLRKKLDELHSGRSDIWLGALLAPKSFYPCWPLSLGTLTMKSKTALFSATALILGIAAAWPLWPSHGDPSLTPKSDPFEIAATNLTTRTAALDSPGDRKKLDSSVNDTAPAINVIAFRARAIDQDARPVAGIRMRLGIDETTTNASFATTDAEGVFEMAVPPNDQRLSVAENHLATVLGINIGPETHRGQEPTVIVADALDLQIAVTDEEALPLEGAKLRCLIPRDFRARFPFALDHGDDPQWTTSSDAHGATGIWRMGKIRGSVIVVQLPGYHPERLPQPAQSNQLTVILRRPKPADGVILGQVTDPSGYPVADARIALGSANTVSRDNGMFSLPANANHRERRLVAIKVGFQPGEYLIPDSGMPGPHRSTPLFVHLHLGVPPLSMAGTVVDEAGMPIQDVRIVPLEITNFGLWDRRAVAVEHHLATGLLGTDWEYGRSDDLGHFIVKGLLSHDYTLRAILPDTQLYVDAGPFPAGDRAVRITLPTNAIHESVGGRIVDASGNPIADAYIRATGDHLKLVRERGYSSWGDQDGPVTKSNAEGRFELGALAHRGVYLRINSDQIIPRNFYLDQGGTPVSTTMNDLEIVVSSRLHFRIELSDSNFADSFTIYDLQNDLVWITLMKGDTQNTDDRPLIIKGHSKVLSVGTEAQTLVLHKRDQEVLRLPLNLKAGQITVIRI